MMSLLLERGATAGMDHSTASLLHMSARKTPSTIRCLLPYTDPLERNFMNKIPVELAISDGSFDLVRTFFEYGVTVPDAWEGGDPYLDYRTDGGLTLLEYANHLPRKQVAGYLTTLRRATWREHFRAYPLPVRDEILVLLYSNSRTEENTTIQTT